MGNLFTYYSLMRVEHIGVSVGNDSPNLLALLFA